jgi:hypothetical protein
LATRRRAASTSIDEGPYLGVAKHVLGEVFELIADDERASAIFVGLACSEVKRVDAHVISALA